LEPLEPERAERPDEPVRRVDARVGEDRDPVPLADLPDDVLGAIRRGRDDAAPRAEEAAESVGDRHGVAGLDHGPREVGASDRSTRRLAPDGLERDAVAE